MAKELVMKAATVEEAQAKLVEALGVPAASIRFETLTAPQKKTLGLFGGADAEVKGTVVDGAAEAAKAFLEDVLTEMGAADFTVTVNETKDTCLMVVEGEDLGFIIGRRGETLDALQYLVGLVANRIDKDYCRINIDIGNYREKREKTLVALAKKMGAQAAKTGRRCSLEPMNPYERRIIHTTVQDIDGATSWSVGSDSARHVVIGPSDDNPVKQQRNSRRRSRKNNDGGARTERPARRETEVAEGRPVRQFVPRSNPLPMVDGATPPQKTESQAEQSAFLYGRIDL
ncbi:MAG: protein jag [Clostridia bacterium]|nr:protein jag [Clostridia bacterium]